MTRSIKKAVNDYWNYTEKKGRNTGAIYAGDIQELIEMSTKAGHTDVFELASNGLMAGYMLGYRRAKREEARGK